MIMTPEDFAALAAHESAVDSYQEDYAERIDKLRDAIVLAVRTTRGLPTVRENPAVLAGVDTLVCLIGSCCKDTDDTFDYDDYLRSCGVRQSLGMKR
jgi:hypothetical protein